MKKAGCFILVLSTLLVFKAYSQHVVNDIGEYQGWYKIYLEINTNNNKMNYIITQCYPNGDEYVVSTIERRQLPLYVKVLCMNLGDELIEAQTQTGGMAVDEHGIRMTIVGFTLLLDSQQSENEILDSFGKETVNKYRNRNW